MRVSATLFRRGRIYYMKWLEAGKWATMSLRTRSQAEALKLKAAKEEELRSMALGVRPNVSMSLEEALRKSLTLKKLAPATVVSRERARKLFEKHHGPMLLTDIRKHHILSWRTHLQSEGYETSYINNVVITISAIMNAMVEAEVLQSNPLAGIKALREERPVRYLDWADCEKLLAAARRPFPYLAIVLGLYAGLRRGEILALEWKHVDWVGEQIWVPGTKTAASKDYVPLHQALREALEPYRKSGSVVEIEKGTPEKTMWTALKETAARADVEP